MVGDSDVLKKLDALLNKHRASGTAVAADADIPVLTEIVDAPLLPPTDDVPAPPTAPAAASAALTDAEVEVLARDIFRRVMARLGDHIATDLRDHLTQRLSSIIDNTVAAALADFNQELADTVGDAIAEVLLERTEKLAAAEPTQPENPADTL